MEKITLDFQPQFSTKIQLVQRKLFELIALLNLIQAYLQEGDFRYVKLFWGITILAIALFYSRIIKPTMFSLHIYTIKYILTILIVFILAGCSSTRILTTEKEISKKNYISFEKFNKLNHNKSLTVMLRDGNNFQATELRLENDSTYFTNEATETRQSIPTKDIEKFIYRDYFGGGLTGFMLGMLGGASAGFIPSYLFFNRDSEMAGLGILVFTGVGGVLGGVVGLTYGLITGHTYNFEMTEKNTNDSK